MTQKVRSINFQPLAVFKLSPLPYHICRKSFEKSCLSFIKTKKTVPKVLLSSFKIKIRQQL